MKNTIFHPFDTFLIMLIKTVSIAEADSSKLTYSCLSKVI